MFGILSGGELVTFSPQSILSSPDYEDFFTFCVLSRKADVFNIGWLTSISEVVDLVDNWSPPPVIERIKVKKTS